jgi:hypothetical protein
VKKVILTEVIYVQDEARLLDYARAREAELGFEPGGLGDLPIAVREFVLVNPVPDPFLELGLSIDGGDAVVVDMVEERDGDAYRDQGENRLLTRLVRQWLEERERLDRKEIG